MRCFPGDSGSDVKSLSGFLAYLPFCDSSWTCETRDSMDFVAHPDKKSGETNRNGIDLGIYSRLSLSRNRRDPQKQFEKSILRHIRLVVLRKKQFEQPNFTNDYVI